MTEIVFANEVLSALVLFSIIGIIGIFLVKLYNILHAGQVYEIQMSVITLAVGFFAYLFIEIGLFLNLTIEYNVYLWLSRGLMLMITIFWVVELLVYAAVSVVEAPLQRMQKRRADRLQNNMGYS